jgi:hypothetical protein
MKRNKEQKTWNLEIFPTTQKNESDDGSTKIVSRGPEDGGVGDSSAGDLTKA